MRTDSARQECEEKRMVPLSAKITQRVHGEVLATVTCNGRNMWQAVLDDIDQVCVCVCVCRVCVCVQGVCVLSLIHI